MISFAPNDVDYLLTPSAVRERSQKLFQEIIKGKGHFQYNEENLEKVATFVGEVIKENYPDLQIPYHSRWNHFNVGEVDRVAQVNQLLNNYKKTERAQTKIDLAVTSVLLDAGSGPDCVVLRAQSRPS